MLAIYKTISHAIHSAYPVVGSEQILFSRPPSLTMGDVAIPVFTMAKTVGKSPVDLAREMSTSVDWGEWISSAVPTGPYVNLFFDRHKVGKYLMERILGQKEHWGSNSSGTGKRVLIEHTSINPNASPHVGRGRCAMIGDSIARLFRFEGYDVEVHYYVNDMGRQIGLLVLIINEIEEISFDKILDAYVKANQRAEQDPEFARRGYELLARMEAGDPEVRQQFRKVTTLCIQGQMEVLHRIGATYDCFDYESTYVNDNRFDQIEQALKEKSALFTDEEGRLVVDLRPLGYEPDEGRYFVLKRANGSSMYGYRDLLYALDKYNQGADINLMVLGEDHKLYAQQQALILQTANITPPEVIYYSYILLKEGKMSTRQGKVVLLSDFLDQATKLAFEKVSEQYPDVEETTRYKIAAKVAVAAIRFSVLRVKASKNVVFDIEAALSFQGDTGPYIQYCCARIRSILRKWGKEIPFIADTDFVVSTSEEWELLMCLAQFPALVAEAVEQRACSGIANYALDLSHIFTTFYHECPVLTANNQHIGHSRLIMCQATLYTLQNALYILGIETPERM